MLNIFDVRTGKVMRDFKGSADEFAIGGTGGFTGVSWPVFRYVYLKDWELWNGIVDSIPIIMWFLLSC